MIYAIPSHPFSTWQYTDAVLIHVVTRMVLSIIGLAAIIINSAIGAALGVLGILF